MAYPADIYTQVDVNGTTSLATDDHAARHNAIGDEIVSIETTIGTNSGTAVLKNATVGKFAVMNTGGTLNAGVLGTPMVRGGTVGTAIIGTSSIVGGTVNTALITNGTLTGGTITNIVEVRKTLGSAVYSGTAGDTTTLDLSTATRFLVNMPDSAGSVTLAVSNVVENQPFITEILQGTASLGTIGWFTTIRWPGAIEPTLSTTASKKDVFGFLPTSGSTFDGYIVGQDL